MTRPKTTEIPPRYRDAWLRDITKLPPAARVPVQRSGWWRRLWGCADAVPDEAAFAVERDSDSRVTTNVRRFVESWTIGESS